MSPTLIRCLWAGAALLAGSGVLAYFLIALATPAERRDGTTTRLGSALMLGVAAAIVAVLWIGLGAGPATEGGPTSITQVSP